MKYYCYTNTKRNEVKDEAARIKYKKVNIVVGFDDLFKTVNAGDTAIFSDILELDLENEQNVHEIMHNYKSLIDKDVTIRFDKSSPCDSDVIYGCVNNLVDDNLIGKANNKAFDAILELQVETYINYRNSSAKTRKAAMIASYNIDETKKFGRPKGKAKESERAKKTKEIILKESKTFGGWRTDTDCIKLSGVSRNMYYIYKNELLKERDNKNENV